jgi:hypothetical protein
MTIDAPEEVKTHQQPSHEDSLGFESVGDILRRMFRCASEMGPID